MITGSYAEVKLYMSPVFWNIRHVWLILKSCVGLDDRTTCYICRVTIKESLQLDSDL